MSTPAPSRSVPSYTLAAKGLACALVGLVAVSGARAAGTLVAQGDTAMIATCAFAAAGLLLGLVAILRSRTTLTQTTLSQRGLWTRQVALAEITQVKLIHVPGLAWLVAPRLLVKARGRGTLVFHAADPALLRALLERNAAA